MNATEGVVKYRLKHSERPLDAQLYLAELEAWRSVLFRLQLIGRHADRYQGYGYGNVSMRLSTDNSFVITGSQTGHLEKLSRNHYAVITSASPADNVIESYGESPPSSEALTHAVVYAQHPAVAAVVHGHSLEIWRQTLRLNLPHTPASIAYGTPAMACAVAGLLSGWPADRAGTFSMLGHEDGVVAIGRSLTEAAAALIGTLARAIEFDQDMQTR